MALAATAFGVGLYVQASVGIAASVIGGIVLFLVMAASQSAFARGQGQSAIIDRIGALEASFNALSHDFKQSNAGAGSENSKEIQVLASRIEGLKHLVDQADKLGPLADAASQVRRLSSETERLSARFEAFRSQVAIEAQEREEQMKSEFMVLETLVKQMAERLALDEENRQRVLELATGSGAGQSEPEAQPAPAPEPEYIPAVQPEPVPVPQQAPDTGHPEPASMAPIQPQAQLQALSQSQPASHPEPASMAPVAPVAASMQPAPVAEPESEPVVGALTSAAPAQQPQTYHAALSQPEPELSPAASEPSLPPMPEPEPEPVEKQPPLDADEIESLMMEEVRRSIEANKIELYLQPIVMLPQRRVRYYEALSRLKSDNGRVLLPGDYIPLAENNGYMPVIDNVMLFRSVQVLRRLEQRSNARGVFCNISVHSLLDPEFFSEFISFMEQNRNLADSMYFEFSQRIIDHCGPVELESLRALSSLGFRFSLDQVTNLKMDFQALHDKGFRTLKISSDIFLNGMAEAGARIHPADMRSYLERFGMQLIVEKIEDEKNLTSVLEHNVRLGQGYLFSEPRPVRPEVFGGKDKAEAA